MGTQLDDFAPSAVDDYFGPADGEHSGHGNENQIIEDGTNQVLRSFEATRKSRDYAPSQTSRVMKAPSIGTDVVDWSGFSGAAHFTPNGEKRKPRTSRRFSMQELGSGEKRVKPRLQSRASSQSSLNVNGESTPEAVKSSPKRETKKYRNRRHNFQPGSASNHSKGSNPERTNRRLSLNNAGTHNRLEGRGSGSLHRAQRRNSGPGRARRQPNAGARSMSPNAKSRRPATAAASSTTLDVREARRKGVQRTQPNGRRQSRPRTNHNDEDLLKKASSFKW